MKITVQAVTVDTFAHFLSNLSELLEKGLAQFDPAFRPVYTELLPDDLLVLLLAHSSQVLVCLGDLDRALSRCETAVAEARRLSDPHNLAIALGYAWQTRRCVGAEPTSLLRYADELLALAVEHELGQYRDVGLMFRGWSLAALGRPDDGIPLLTRGAAALTPYHCARTPGDSRFLPTPAAWPGSCRRRWRT